MRYGAGYEQVSICRCTSAWARVLVWQSGDVAPPFAGIEAAARERTGAFYGVVKEVVEACEVPQPDGMIIAHAG
jgi:hypothetical protein